MSTMRMVLIQIVGLLITSVLYCLIVPQARTMVMGDAEFVTKAWYVGIRAIGIYVCFLFVYFAFLQGSKNNDMPDKGAYGGYSDDQPGDPS